MFIIHSVACHGSSSFSGAKGMRAEMCRVLAASAVYRSQDRGQVARSLLRWFSNSHPRDQNQNGRWKEKGAATEEHLGSFRDLFFILLFFVGLDFQQVCSNSFEIIIIKSKLFDFLSQISLDRHALADLALRLPGFEGPLWPLPPCFAPNSWKFSRFHPTFLGMGRAQSATGSRYCYRNTEFCCLFGRFLPNSFTFLLSRRSLSPVSGTVFTQLRPLCPQGFRPRVELRWATGAFLALWLLSLQIRAPMLQPFLGVWFIATLSTRDFIATSAFARTGGRVVADLRKSADLRSAAVLEMLAFAFRSTAATLLGSCWNILICSNGTSLFSGTVRVDAESLNVDTSNPAANSAFIKSKVWVDIFKTFFCVSFLATSHFWSLILRKVWKVKIHPWLGAFYRLVFLFWKNSSKNRIFFWKVYCFAWLQWTQGVFYITSCCFHVSSRVGRGTLTSWWTWKCLAWCTEDAGAASRSAVAKEPRW